MSRYTPETTDSVRWALMRQEWNNLLFVHWPVPVAVVQERLPKGVVADEYNGSAWVGVVAFSMERIGTGRGPTVPYLGSFPETNVRTYVRGPDGTPGVWFDSLDINRLLPALVARGTYGLPYMWSKMKLREDGADRSYECKRRWGGPSARSSVSATIGVEIASRDVSPLERFLTCRWGLYSTFVGQLVYAPVEHPEWPLHKATLNHFDDTLSTVAGYPEAPDDPLVHWTPGVSVRIGRPRKVRAIEAAVRDLAVARPRLGAQPTPSTRV